MRAKAAQRILSIVATLALLLALAPSAQAAPDSKGTDFWLTFMTNLTENPTLTLFITGAVSTSGTVAIPGLAFSQAFTVAAGTVTAVVVPTTAVLTAPDGVQDLGIHVTAADAVTVYGLNHSPFSSDAYLGLPTDVLGAEYLVMSYAVGEGSEFAIVAPQSGTTATITPRVAAGAHAAGVPYTVALNQGQAYQLRITNIDLTGTVITANKPVAVFSGSKCTYVPAGFSFCNHLVEEMPPTATWGKAFVTMPLATRRRGDTFRFLASADNTQVSVNGAVVAILNRGQFRERIVTGPARITADKPILVAQYSNSSNYDDATADPFMMLIPPYEQFLADYTVTTPASGFAANYVNVVAPNAAVGAITLDGTAIPAASFTAIPGGGFSGAEVAVALGTHNLAGPLPFGLTVYGFDRDDGYGYTGGASFAPVALATTLTLTPPTAARTTGAQHCVDATVKDQNGGVLAGIRVDFAVTGANPTAGQANTDANGVARFCYTGANGGNDTIAASVGTLSAAAAVTWSNQLTLRVQTEGTGTVGVAPAPLSSTGTPADMTYTYAPGTVVTLTATPGAGQVFIRWASDGVGDAPYGKGWASPLTITLDTSHEAKAFFVPRPIFSDLPAGNAAYLPATELAARGIAKGYTAVGCAAQQPPTTMPCYGPGNRTTRAETALFLTRLLGLAGENHGNGGFTDVASQSPAAQQAIGTLAFHRIFQGYTDGRFGPNDAITHTELTLVISRAFVFKGYWTRATVDVPSIYPNLDLGTQARLDLVTFVQNAGNLPGFANDTPRAAVDQPALRDWTARALWLALNGYFGVDQPGKGGFVP